jgi:hypothetical protein
VPIGKEYAASGWDSSPVTQTALKRLLEKDERMERVVLYKVLTN